MSKKCKVSNCHLKVKVKFNHMFTGESANMKIN